MCCRLRYIEVWRVRLTRASGVEILDSAGGGIEVWRFAAGVWTLELRSSGGLEAWRCAAGV